MVRLRLVVSSVFVLPLFIACAGPDSGTRSGDEGTITPDTQTDALNGLGTWAQAMAGRRNKVPPTTYANAESWADSVTVWLQGAVYDALLSYCDMEKILVDKLHSDFDWDGAGFSRYCTGGGPYADDTDPPPPPGPPPGWD